MLLPPAPEAVLSKVGGPGMGSWGFGERTGCVIDGPDAAWMVLRNQNNGWFVPSQRHVSCHTANDESQAVLHLAAVLMGQPEAVPTFTGAEPFFHAEYGASTGRVYDSADIYGKTRRP